MKKYSNGREVYGAFPSLYQKATLTQVRRYDTLLQRFKKHFGESAYLCSSPGRVEIIGNHTDHNGGKVVGATVSLDILSAFLPNEKRVIIKSRGYRDVSFDVGDYSMSVGSTGMAKGVLRYLDEHGYKTGGFVSCLSSEVPSGSGISSSAAFQMMIAEIENELYNDGKIPAEELARAGQYAENVYFNKPCGLLDQGVIAVGGIVSIDFKDGFNYEKIADNLSQSLVIINTGGSHSSLTDEYASIPAEMKQVANYFGKSRLADVDEKEFYDSAESVAQKVGERPEKRAEHFFEENRRVDEMKIALANGDEKTFIDLVNQSGVSSNDKLQNCTYTGGGTAIPDAVNFAKSICPTCASRVHGGGFAGTVLCVVPSGQVNGFVEKATAKYGKNAVHVVKVRSLGATVL